jgi:two-component system sensor histidine kinase/response regulator
VSEDREVVLVVDDSVHNRMVAVGHLEAAGYEVLAVANGEEAIELLRVRRVSLVVLDVLMPGIGGFETCRRIRATREIADTAILFLTALGDRDTTTPAIEAGGDDLLGKPFVRAELLLRVRALIRLRRMTDELRGALQKLADQNEQLRQAERDKRKISQLIVHDLKGPLAAISANAELLATLVRDPDSAEAVSDIAISAQHLQTTAGSLIDLARAEDGAMAPKLETFDLNALAGEVASSLRGFGRYTNVRIEAAIEVTHLVADRDLTRRLLQNLVHNAVKHAPADSAVRIEAVREGDAVTMRVLDEGPGVAPADSERLFERYVTSDPGGHGLGLAFCRLAAEAHGGKIWVEERRPRGASFCVRIPQPG